MVKVVYNMPESEYRAVKALCQSDVKKILVSWNDYVFDRESEDKPTEAKDIGKAYHKAILENDLSGFTTPLNKDDFLCSKDDYIECAEDCGADFKKSWTKEKIKDAISETGYNANFFDDAIENEKRIILPQEVFDRIEYYRQAIENSPLRKTLDNAKKEVSIFWTDKNGIPCKGRFDALTEYGVFDLKTFDNFMQAPLNKAVNNAIVKFRYDIQGAFYYDAYKAAFEAGEEGFKEIGASFYVLFVQSQKGLNISGRFLSDLSPNNTVNNAYWEKARSDIDYAKILYKAHVIENKPTKHDFTFEPLEDQHFPLYHFSNGDR